MYTTNSSYLWFFCMLCYLHIYLFISRHYSVLHFSRERYIKNPLALLSFFLVIFFIEYLERNNYCNYIINIFSNADKTHKERVSDCRYTSSGNYINVLGFWKSFED